LIRRGCASIHVQRLLLNTPSLIQHENRLLIAYYWLDPKPVYSDLNHVSQSSKPCAERHQCKLLAYLLRLSSCLSAYFYSSSSLTRSRRGP